MTLQSFIRLRIASMLTHYTNMPLPILDHSNSRCNSRGDDLRNSFHLMIAKYMNGFNVRAKLRHHDVKMTSTSCILLNLLWTSFRARGSTRIGVTGFRFSTFSVKTLFDPKSGVKKPGSVGTAATLLLIRLTLILEKMYLPSSLIWL
jgi:hypothetical protein